MSVTTKWLTPQDAKKVQDTSLRVANEIVTSALPDWPTARAQALLTVCMGLWSKGPLVTANILARNADLIIAAWEMRSHIAGVMLIRKGESFVPLYLHRHLLALKMQSPTALWIDFTPLKEVGNA